MSLKIVSTIEEQMAVQFTGKLNILSNFNRQYLGHLTFDGGELICAAFQGQKGLKAFFQIAIQEFTLNSFVYIVEPEIVEDVERDILLPYAVLKERIDEVLALHQQSLKLRPPENVRIVVSPDFLSTRTSVTPQEYSVLLTLTEWSAPFDIYQHCSLLDHEITLALVELRKKKALKIVAPATI